MEWKLAPSHGTDSSGHKWHQGYILSELTTAEYQGSYDIGIPSCSDITDERHCVDGETGMALVPLTGSCCSCVWMLATMCVLMSYVEESYTLCIREVALQISISDDVPQPHDVQLKVYKHFTTRLWHCSNQIAILHPCIIADMVRELKRLYATAVQRFRSLM